MGLLLYDTPSTVAARWKATLAHYGFGVAEDDFFEVSDPAQSISGVVIRGDQRLIVTGDHTESAEVPGTVTLQFMPPDSSSHALQQLCGRALVASGVVPNMQFGRFSRMLYSGPLEVAQRWACHSGMRPWDGATRCPLPFAFSLAGGGAGARPH